MADTDSEKGRRIAGAVGGGDGGGWRRRRRRGSSSSSRELGRVGMGGWLNFSSDHVEPIKADHGTQSPPPTSSTFFVLSLFPPRVLAFIHPLAAPPPPCERERTASLSRIPHPSLPSRAPASVLVAHPSKTPALLPAPRVHRLPSPPSFSSRHVRSLTHSLATRWIFSRHEAV